MKYNLELPRPSPKMERIYSAMNMGWPDCEINDGNADINVLWGLIGNNPTYIKSGKPYIFVDMPYHGRLMANSKDHLQESDYNRSYWRFCYNGLHNNEKLDVPGDRFEEWHTKIQPWQTDTDHILLCPSSDSMTQMLHGCSSADWTIHVMETLRQYTNRPIRVRNKPRANGTSGPAVAKTPIEYDLEGCHALVTSASISAVDALKAGVPVFATSHQCPTAWCTNFELYKINNPAQFDRELLFNNLAYRQFSIREINNGTAYEIWRRMADSQGWKA